MLKKRLLKGSNFVNGVVGLPYESDVLLGEVPEKDFAVMTASQVSSKDVIIAIVTAADIGHRG